MTKRLLVLLGTLGTLVACTPQQHAAWQQWHAIDPTAAEAFAEEWKTNHIAQAETPAQSSGNGGGSDYGKWAPILQCESGGNWSISRGHYEGGLQFDPGTWDAYGGERYAEHAYDASPWQQIEIAERVLDDQGWRAWPTCSRRAGYR